MSADHTEHAAEAPHGHAFDSPEEVAHAKEHALQNFYFFLGFFALILCAVANYELFGTENLYLIFFLVATRVALIAIFMNWLFGHFSLVFRTIAFTVFFFCGMVLLSWWDSELPHLGNPIKLPPHYDETPKPTAKP